MYRPYSSFNLTRDSLSMLDDMMYEPLPPLNEAVAGKMTSLRDLADYLSSRQISFYTSRGSKGAYQSPDNITVRLFFMNTEKVTIDPTFNLLNLYFGFNTWSDSEDVIIDCRGDMDFQTTLEDFMKLPKKVQGASQESAEYISSICDAPGIYNLYKERALSIVRKYFPYAYHMFTGPSLTTREERSGTLYVTYDKMRKKFRYGYNPHFILEAAVEEFMIHKNRYKSLEDCYTYILAYMIIHEMLHIVHHNTTTTQDGDNLITVGDHGISNSVQDSFINCKIAQRLSLFPGIITEDSLAPCPSLGVGSEIIVRAEHNKGFKKYTSSKALAKAIAMMFQSLIKKQGSINYYNLDSTPIKLDDYAGADIFISIDIGTKVSFLRGAGSNLFQRAFTEIVKLVTDGQVFDKFSKMSDEEKADDLKALPVGSLVMVKGSRAICHIKSYDAGSGTYTLTETTILGTKSVNVNGVSLKVTDYGKTDKVYGTKKRLQIRPYDPIDDAYTDQAKPKQTKLTPEDMTPQPPSDMPNTPPQSNPQSNPKSFNIGDIVWIRKKGAYGKIISIQDGKFSLELMKELPCKILDDSDNRSDL